MQNFGISLHLQTLLASYLDRRTFCVRIHNTYSQHCNIKAGVPQGGKLSAILYAIYTSDYPEANVLPDDLNGEDEEEAELSALYADDTAEATTAPTLERAKQLLTNRLHTSLKWATIWRVKYNKEKTQLLHINLHNRNVNKKPISIEFDGTTVTSTPTVKYLVVGVTLDTRLTFAAHTANAAKAVTARFQAVKRILPSTAKTRPILLQVYKQGMQPIMTYATSAMSTMTQEALRNLTRRERSVLRYVLYCPAKTPLTTIYQDSKIQRVEKLIRSNRRKDLRKAQGHDNPLIAGLAKYNNLDWEVRRPGDFGTSSDSNTTPSESD